MNLKVNNLLGEHSGLSKGAPVSDGAEFQSAVRSALIEKKLPYTQNEFGVPVIISSKYEKELEQDPALKEALKEKLENKMYGCGNCHDDIVIVDRNGEITEYCLKREKERFRKPSSEELKKAAKARARKRARLSAYFRRIERYGIKRKLVEQANAKRIRGKKLRISVTKLNTIAESLITIKTPLNPEYFY